MLVHSDSDRLTRAFAKCASHACSWRGELYRSSSPRYANKDDLLTGTGSKTAGPRWNPPNNFRTLYTSLDPYTAIAEALSHFVYFALPIATAMPRVIVSLEARLGRVLNLNDRAVRRVLGISRRRLLDEPWREEQKLGREALTQVLGRLAFDADWEGLLVPSAARRGGINLIAFPANFDVPRSWLRIINRADLPRRP
jgi:RES domain-containing protein